MMKPILVSISVFILCVSDVFAKPLPLTEKQLASPPPRIIRTCCSFGSEVGVFMMPLFSITDITAPGILGAHQYLGNEAESNGIIYTARGGFIDMGHLRDQADWTAYLYGLILHHKLTSDFIQDLGYEGGPKKLTLEIPSDIDSADALLLAGRIAYDLSVWHEIATWFGASYIPMVPERYSSFSIEDPYSNLLGVQLGMKALSADQPYEAAMTMLISQTLKELGAVNTMEETAQAMEAVRDIWWTRERNLPSSKVLLERELNVYYRIKPMLIDGFSTANAEACILEVPVQFHTGEPIENLYSLEFRLNFKFPIRKIFPDDPERNITQVNFDTLIQTIENELKYKAQRKAKPAPEHGNRQNAGSKANKNQNRVKTIG